VQGEIELTRAANATSGFEQTTLVVTISLLQRDISSHRFSHQYFVESWTGSKAESRVESAAWPRWTGYVLIAALPLLLRTSEQDWLTEWVKIPRRLLRGGRTTRLVHY
jgi:hypothetical protein